MAGSRGMKAGAWTFQVEGLDKLLAKLTPELYQEAGKATLQEISEIAAGYARAGAPRLTGKLQTSITPKVNPGAKPAWAAVKVGALNQKGYSYPRLLEFNGKYHHKNWLKSAIQRASGAFSSAVGKAATVIEGKWGS